MDEIVARGMARWPNVPAVYGWLQLDRRGNWRIKGEKVPNQALREFIARNYQADERGCWYFQNGPQRVFVELAYAPLVLHYEGAGLFDHCARPFAPGQFFQLCTNYQITGEVVTKTMLKIVQEPGTNLLLRAVAENFNSLPPPE